MTELAPWLIGGAIIGGITARALEIDGSLGVLVGAVGAFVLVVLLYNAAEIYRRLRERLKGVKSRNS
jgi:hypothetical protein